MTLTSEKLTQLETRKTELSAALKETEHLIDAEVVEVVRARKLGAHLLTVPQIAIATGRTPASVRNLMVEEEVKAKVVKDGGRALMTYADVCALIMSRRANAAMSDEKVMAIEVMLGTGALTIAQIAGAANVSEKSVERVKVQLELRGKPAPATTTPADPAPAAPAKVDPRDVGVGFEPIEDEDEDDILEGLEELADFE